MTTQVQIRGAVQATQEARTLASRELDVNTTDKRVCLHDGSTAGGIPHLNYIDAQNQEYTYGAAAGTNSITVDMNKAPSAYAAGQRFSFKAAATNTGSATLNVNSLGAKTIKKVEAGALVTLDPNDIVIDSIHEVAYNGVDMILLGGSSAAPVTSDTGTIIFDGAVTGGSAFQDFTWANSLYKRLLIDINNLSYLSSPQGGGGYIRFFSNGTIQASSNQYASWQQLNTTTTNAITYNPSIHTGGSPPGISAAIPITTQNDLRNAADGYSGRFEISNLLSNPLLKGVHNTTNTTEMVSLEAKSQNLIPLFSGIRIGISNQSGRNLDTRTMIKIVGFT